MECINHPGKMAAGTCQVCGKGLCAECANRFSPTVCETCLLENNNSVARRLIFDVALTLIIFVGVSIWIAMSVETHKSHSVIPALFIAGGLWGWQLINRLPLPILIVSLPVLGMMYVFKAVFALIIGIFAMPIMLFLRIRDILKINTLKKNILAGKV